MIEIGRLCVKIAGRDAGQKCVIVDILDNTYVLIDGETRRRKCNILHLEPLPVVIDLKKNALHEEVASALKQEGIDSRSTKPKKAAAKPIKKRKSSEELRQGKQQRGAGTAGTKKQKKAQGREQASTTLDKTLEEKTAAESMKEKSDKKPSKKAAKEQKAP